MSKTLKSGDQTGLETKMPVSNSKLWSRLGLVSLKTEGRQQSRVGAAKQGAWEVEVPQWGLGAKPGRVSGGLRSPEAEALLQNCTIICVSALTNFIGLVMRSHYSDDN